MVGVEEGRLRQGDRHRGDVGAAFGHPQDGAKFGVGAAMGLAEEAQAEAWLEGQRGAAGEAEGGRERDALAQGRGELAADLRGSATGRVHGEAGAVEGD